MNDETVMLVGGPQHGWDVEMPRHSREYLIPKPFSMKDLQGQVIPEGQTIPDHRLVTGRYLVGIAADGVRFAVWQGWA